MQAIDQSNPSFLKDLFFLSLVKSVMIIHCIPCIYSHNFNLFQTLESLEAKNKDLLEKVRHLEAEKHIVEEYLKSCVKIPWCPYHHSCRPYNCTPTPHNTNLPPKTFNGNTGNMLPRIPSNGNILPLTPPHIKMESHSVSGLNNTGPDGISGSGLDNAGAVGIPGSGLDNAGAMGMSMGVLNNNNMPLGMRMEERMESSMPLSLPVGSGMSLRMSRVSPTIESSGSSVS